MITFLGDVALISKDLKSDYKPSCPYIFNLEYVLGSNEHLTPVSGKINLCSEYDNFDEIFGANPIAVNIANNHICDYHSEGLKNTVSKVSEKGIKIIESTPLFLSESVCMLSYMSFGENGQFKFEYDKALQNIKSIKEKNAEAVIIIQMHWGIENSPIQDSRQTEIAHWLIDNGADLIIGHHPHCIQPVEKYHGKYIFYSLGNTLFGNINLPSFYDGNGIPRRKYRFKWQRYNRKSLAVVFDENAKRLVRIDELYQYKNTLKCKRQNVSVEKYEKITNAKLADLIYKVRKYLLFFVSNSFVDGKLFDFNVLFHELRK